MKNLDLLKRICETPGVSGFERRIRNLILQEVRGLADSVSVDNMGNVIAVRKGREPKRVMVAAHMDEIGFIVNHVDENGFIRFLPLGGFDPKTLTAQRVVVHGRRDVVGVMGSKPIHIMKTEERNKVVPVNDYFIDLGLPKEEIDQLVGIGDPITRERDLIEMGDCVTGKSLDNRVSVFILLETLRRLQGQELPYDLYATFTVQEEVGLRGAMGSVGHIDPDFGFGLDVTIAYDVPGSSSRENVTCLGKGAAIKILDGSVISDFRMVNYLKEVAQRREIPTQLELLPAGGTDTAALQRYGTKGCIAGAISIPLRNMHQVIEMASRQDIEHCTALLTASLLELDTYDWDFTAAHGDGEHPDRDRRGDFDWL
ncbi:M42 family metallopeptidase [Neolewinella litorea]|uniref:M42 family peptidase n=1 Tax=Neolewinella litorea TaxID=2562452 RepID=A0A4S4NKU1_9BACT|nr:M42 family metallopeptidase [Neolewinella litorea]THH39447.1 M42 family peptidase [Neolewinella litorea]